MGWKFFGEAAEESLTAAEWERIFLLVNQIGLPHREDEIDILHCPSCRNAHAVVMLERETTLGEAAAAVAAMPASALVDAFTFSG